LNAKAFVSYLSGTRLAGDDHTLVFLGLHQASVDIITQRVDMRRDL
jgi:hypothetical protein